MHTISLGAALFMLASLGRAFDRQALASWFTGLNPDKVIHAINCGSNEEIVDQLGVTYSPVRKNDLLLMHFGRTSDSWVDKHQRLAQRFNGLYLIARSITLRDGAASSIRFHFPRQMILSTL